MKLHLPNLNYSLIMGWLFILSIPAIPLSWIFLSPGFLLFSLAFFFCMLMYQAGEVFYNEYKERKRIVNEINATRHLDGTTILHPIRTQRIQITKHLQAFYSTHTRAVIFECKADRDKAERLYNKMAWIPPSFNWFIDTNLFRHLDKNLKA